MMNFIFPVALGLFKFNLSVGQDVSLMMAGAVIASIPSILLFAALQRYFVEGVTLTGTKE
jgi:multiple sugar transport system permease protein